MSTHHKRNSKFGGFVFPVCCLLLCLYFAHHLFNGHHGLHAQRESVETALHLKYQLAALKIERKKLETRVSLLKNGSIERDMLDEQARYHLNLLHEDEIVIMR